MKSENKLATQERLNKLTELTGYTENQITVIKNTVAKGTTDAELAMFGSMAKNYKLDPFNKEIWCYKDGKQNLIIFAGRDGFLKIAQNNSRWNGIVSGVVRENDFFEVDIPKGIISHKPDFKNKGKILLAYCYIKPKRCETATIEIADFETYNKGYNVWKSHPGDMIKKVAEVKALKKAFGITGLHDENDFFVQNDKVIPIDTETEVDSQTYVYIENLLSTCSLDEDTKCSIEKELENGIYTVRADELISYLKDNQLQSIDSGNMSQKEVTEQLNLKLNDKNA